MATDAPDSRQASASRHPRLGDLPQHTSAIILSVVADLRLHDDLSASELNIATSTSSHLGLTVLVTRSSQRATLTSSALARQLEEVHVEVELPTRPVALFDDIGN